MTSDSDMSRPSPEEDRLLIPLAVERGWIDPSQVDRGLPMTEVLDGSQIKELRRQRSWASGLLGGGLLSAEDLVEEPPEQFGRYERIRLLGRGGAGAVYLAHDPEIGRQVALKVLHRDRAKLIDRFRNEMHVLSRLQHPNIVSIFDAGIEEGRPYYTMEYVGDLSLASGDLPLKDHLEVIETVARACHVAHEAGVVHRDLKPSNILLGQRPVVADFGLAKTEASDITATGEVMGTVHYMSPEQAASEEVDRRTDIWSMGVMLYQVLCGRLPFLGTGGIEVLRQILDVEPASPRSIDGTISRDLEVITLRAMARNREDRYSTALELAEDLANWREGRPIKARPLSGWRRLKGWVGRHRVVGVGLLVLALTLGLVGLAVRDRERGEQGQRLQEAQAVLLQERLRVSEWEKGLHRPVHELSYEVLETSQSRLGSVLEYPELPPSIRAQLFEARARVRRHLGRLDPALDDLEQAIELHAVKDLGPALLDRIQILWDRHVLISLFFDKDKSGKDESGRMLELLCTDLDLISRTSISSASIGDFLILLRSYLEPPKGTKRREWFKQIQGRVEEQGDFTEEVQKMLGDLALLERRILDARRSYARAIKQRPGYVEVFLGQALAYALEGRQADFGSPDWIERFSSALDRTRVALRINPRHEGSYGLIVRLSSVLFHHPPTEFAAALPAFPKSLLIEFLGDLKAYEKLDPQPPKRLGVHARMSFLAAAQYWKSESAGRYLEEAEGLLLRCAEAAPQETWPWVWLTISQIVRSKIDGISLEKARNYLGRARTIDPESYEVPRWLGWCAYFEGSREEASRHWKEALALSPPSGIARNLERILKKGLERVR
jgi:tetratricopeptide (TPR) repeat protein